MGGVVEMRRLSFYHRYGTYGWTEYSTNAEAIMLLEQRTKDEFGYLPKTLGNYSKKKIVLACDYCGKEYPCTKKQRTNYHKNSGLATDACKGCRYKKRKDVENKYHGGLNPSQREDVQERIRKTNREKYGKDYFVQTDKFQEKFKDASLEKFGTEHPMQNKEYRRNWEDNFQKKHGVKNPSQSKEINEKRKKTNLEKYGCESTLSLPEVREKITATVRKRYNVDNPFQSSEIQEKIRQTHMEKRGVEHHFKDPEVAMEHGQMVLKSKIDKGLIDIYKGKTQREWRNEIGYSPSRFHALIKKYGWEQAINMTPQISYIEKLVCDMLDKLEIEYDTQFKVGSKIADIYVPKGNLLIETDGLYWHSDRIYGSHYHWNKKKLYSQHGYQSFFFREDEIRDKLNIIESIIINKLGHSNSIYARSCPLVRNLNKKLTKDFFDANHLMGNGGGKVYALKYDGNVVCMMQFKSRGDDHYEISRFCPQKGWSIVGGFSKLLSHFISDHKVGTVSTFVDLRYGDGSYLLDLGFYEKNRDVSFKWTDTVNTFHRMKFKGNSGYDYNLFKIFDCGQAKYVLDTG